MALLEDFPRTSSDAGSVPWFPPIAGLLSEFVARSVVLALGWLSVAHKDPARKISTSTVRFSTTSSTNVYHVTVYM